MLATDPRTPGIYYFAGVIGTPPRVGDAIPLLVEHGGESIRWPDGCRVLASAMWEDLAGTPDRARLLANKRLALHHQLQFKKYN